MAGSLLLDTSFIIALFARDSDDIWIASIVRQHRLTVATRDAHFGEMPGLVLVS